jgi:tetratricopeptide (TPR) repeat protein
MFRAHGKSSLFRHLRLALVLIAVAYAVVAGLRTVSDYDLGWQLATGRWVAQHHRIVSTDVFSYTAQGQPWIYPVGSGLLLYLAFVAGGYALLSWLGAAACAGTVALLLRRGSAFAAAIAVLAIPRLAARTPPRAEMFTVVLFAAFLSLLWQQHRTGRARLWLLPVLMAAWVNLHLGFLAGLAMIAGYVLVEVLELPFARERQVVLDRLKQAAPWFAATLAATLLNPWGWGIYRAIVRQESAMKAHAQWITEWAGTRLNWTSLEAHFSLRDPNGAFLLLLIVAGLAVVCAMLERRFGAAILLAAATVLGARHVRLQALFACLLVVIGGEVLQSAWELLRPRIPDEKLRSILAVGATALVFLLIGVRSYDLVSNRRYLAATEISSFGPGLSWWFPQRAMDFIDREKVPAEIFNQYNAGGFLVWRLGPKYRDYVDGRAIPFGPESFQRQDILMQSPPDSEEWQREADRYGIHTILVSLARYDGLQFIPGLRQFCNSQSWRPVFMDEVSAVFVRRTPQNEGLIQRYPVDCQTAPLPIIKPESADAAAFNQWANAAAVLMVLGRNSEAFSATGQALAIFPESAVIHFLRGNLFVASRRLAEAESEYQTAVALDPSDVTWSVLGQLYQAEGRQQEAIDAFERAAALAAKPHGALLSLAQAYLQARRPQDALRALDEAAASLPAETPEENRRNFLAQVAAGKAVAWQSLGNLERAAASQEEAVRLAPERSELWSALAGIYELQGRQADAERARTRAAGPGSQ